MCRLETIRTSLCVRVTWRSTEKTNSHNGSTKWVYLLTIGTIYDIFENQSDYLILAQSIGTGKTFNHIIYL
jgi:hypothetical protein